MSKQNKVNAGFLGSFISFVIAVFLSFQISNSCAYHEPISREPGVIFNLFFDLISSHPETNSFYWLFALFFGFIGGMVIRKAMKIKFNQSQF